MAEAETPRMPMFYRAPAVLGSREHGNLAVVKKRNYSFSAKVNSIPVVLNEVPLSIPHYPVAFTLGDEPMLMAIVGARNDENLFVDEEGNWEPGRYIPAYVRRFPFVLMEPPDRNFRLAAELDSGFLGLKETGCSRMGNRRSMPLTFFASAWNCSKPSRRHRSSVRPCTRRVC